MMQHTAYWGCSRGSAVQCVRTLLASGSALMTYPVMVLGGSQG